MHKKKISVAWSGGKDSMLALDRIIKDDRYKLDHLHTVVDEETRRVGLHGIHEKFIDQQAASLGLPLQKLYLSASASSFNYEQLMKGYFSDLDHEEFDGVLFGDIFLEDLKAYREKLLTESDSGLEPIYPLWQEDTKSLMSEFLDKGYKTLLCAADKKYFSEKDLGQTIDKSFIESLSPDINVCGENGEYHTFVYDGPLFHFPVAFETGEIVTKSYTYNKKNDDGSIEELLSSFLFVDLKI